MSSLLTLATLNWDVLLGIIEHDIDVPTLISLRSTSKNLYNFVNIKATWITVLKNLSRLHPINLPTTNPSKPLSTLSLSQMMSIAVKAHNLRQNWLSPTPEPRPSFQVVALPPTYSIVSILLVPHSPYLLVLSESSKARASSTVTCIDLQRGKPVATCTTTGVVSSWRAEVTSEDSIAICLLIGPENRLAISPEQPALFKVIRLNLPNASSYSSRGTFEDVSSHIITTPITGMFLTAEVAGLISVIATTRTSGLLMTNFQTGNTANINTGIPVNKPSLNTIADGSHLILYTEDELGAYVYGYNFQTDLLPHFSPSPNRTAQSLIHVEPTILHSYKFNKTEVCDNAWPAYTIIRSKWKDLHGATKKADADGLISVLSMSYVLAADPSGLNDYRCVSQRFLNPYEKGSQKDSDKESEEGEGDSEEDAVTEVETADEQEVESMSFFAPMSPSTPALDSGLLAQSSEPFATILTLPASPMVPSHPFGSPTSSTSGPFSQALEQSQKRMEPMAKRTFHSCWEVKQEIMQGPSRNDLIAVGSGSSHAVWLASNLNNAFAEPELRLASFSPNALGEEEVCCEASGGRIRTLRLPASLNARDISAIALDDASGVLALSTIRSELWILDYAVRPSNSGSGGLWDGPIVEI